MIFLLFCFITSIFLIFSIKYNSETPGEYDFDWIKVSNE